MKPILYILLKKNNKNRAEEMAQQLGALAALIEDPGLGPRAHTVDNNCL